MKAMLKAIKGIALVSVAICWLVGHFHPLPWLDGDFCIPNGWHDSIVLLFRE